MIALLFFVLYCVCCFVLLKLKNLMFINNIVIKNNCYVKFNVKSSVINILIQKNNSQICMYI